MTQDNQANIPSEEEFPAWLEKNIGVGITSGDIIHYNSATSQMKDQLLESPFWKLLCKNLNEYDASYFSEYQNDLLKEEKSPKIELKEPSSFLNKVYRQNVVGNRNFPHEPDSGWVLPINWFSKINDILRTTIVVKYLDGVEYLAKRLEALCSENSNLIDKCCYQARIEGYYAAHLYFGIEFEIPKKDWETQRVYSSVEIQITTQVKEVIKELLHKQYEKSRLKRSSDEDIWQWRYNSPEFATNYLGHIIHYVEGMIVGIRKEEK